MKFWFIASKTRDARDVTFGEENSVFLSYLNEAAMFNRSSATFFAICTYALYSFTFMGLSLSGNRVFLLFKLYKRQLTPAITVINLI
ncbi:hypothetical protein D3C78_1447440 [compost metagenome]